ncbi:response regulator [Variovorax sp. HJSM1_2]|uniref:response regulator n=1 Tax=Variovorax sp. HJSM1_2 TaxID=3366263 RepID=UPI003BC0CB5E
MPIATILIEDSPKIREALIPSMLELANLEVVAIAETAEEGLRVLKANTWRLAVVDLFLAEGSGMEVLRRLSPKSHGQFVVVLTNYPTGEIRNRCLALGATAIFDKSTELDEFFVFCEKLFSDY